MGVIAFFSIPVSNIKLKFGIQIKLPSSFVTVSEESVFPLNVTSYSIGTTPRSRSYSSVCSSQATSARYGFGSLFSYSPTFEISETVVVITGFFMVIFFTATGSFPDNSLVFQISPFPDDVRSSVIPACPSVGVKETAVSAALPSSR